MSIALDTKRSHQVDVKPITICFFVFFKCLTLYFLISAKTRFGQGNIIFGDATWTSVFTIADASFTNLVFVKSFLGIIVNSHERHEVSNHRPFDCIFSGICIVTFKNYRSPTSLRFVWGNHRWPVVAFTEGKRNARENVFMSWRHQG